MPRRAEETVVIDLVADGVAEVFAVDNGAAFAVL
jgi:hypothetical protein